ncbi:MAG TPA: hypothetical protein VGD62_01075 [Acidobacteriaceae bacterium]
MPEDERVVTLRISEGSEQLIEALERIDKLERLLQEATHFIEVELKRVACGDADTAA